nr:type II toxin-antitoxin system VapC family toxin [Desulfobulbaceae bacterium]
MTSATFVDTVAWLALVNKSDNLHKAACAVRDQLLQQKTKLITTNFVAVEIANSLARPPLRDVAIKLLNFIQTSTAVDLVTITPELSEMAYKLYCSRPDKEWGLTDCTSFVVMKSMRLQRAFTADRHFEQDGFLLLLK